MRGRWNYHGLGKVTYGSPRSYEMAAAWFDEVGGTAEDWGCGCAAFKEYLKKCSYIGIEGSKNDFADRCDVDLAEYQSSADCILLRDVLDHNLLWRKLLANALASFKKRMVIVTFREMGPDTRIVFVNTSEKYLGVPDLRLKAGDLTALFSEYLVKIERIGCETLFFLEKSA